MNTDAKTLPYLGFISLAAGALALCLAMADYKLEFFPRPQEPEKTSWAKKVKNFTKRILGGDEEVKTLVPIKPSNAGKYLYWLMIAMSVTGVICGAASWAIGEPYKYALLGAFMSVFAVLWESVVLAVTMAVTIIVVISFLAYAEF